MKSNESPRLDPPSCANCRNYERKDAARKVGWHTINGHTLYFCACGIVVGRGDSHCHKCGIEIPTNSEKS